MSTITKTTLPTIKVTDVPACLPEPITRQLGTIKGLFVTGPHPPHGNHYVELSLSYNPYYPLPADNEPTISLWWRLKEEFLDPTYITQIAEGKVTKEDALSYRTNFQQITRSFFRSLLMEAIDFTAPVAGKMIMFSAEAVEDMFVDKGYRYEPSRLLKNSFRTLLDHKIWGART